MGIDKILKEIKQGQNILRKAQELKERELAIAEKLPQFYMDISDEDYYQEAMNIFIKNLEGTIKKEIGDSIG